MQAELTEGQLEARIRALQASRAAKAAATGSVPNAISMNARDMEAVLGKVEPADEPPPPTTPTPRERSVLDAAWSLYGKGGVARPSEIAKRMGIRDIAVSQSISDLRRKGSWPYTSPYAAHAANANGKPKAKAKPKAAAVEAPAASVEVGACAAMLAVLDAVDSLPAEARAALVAHLARREGRRGEG